MDHRFEKFIAVVEAQSFTVAAKQLHVSQPALSSAIHALEKDLNAILIQRKGRHFALTNEGSLAYASARRMQREHAGLKREISSAVVAAPQLRIGLLDTTATLLLQSDYDWRGIEIVVDNSARLLEYVDRERVDAAIIVSQIGALPDGLSAQAIGSEQFVFVATPDVARATTGLAIGNWLAFNADSTTYLQFTRQFKDAKLQVTPIFHSTSMELLRLLCLQGRGAALLPRHMVAEDLAANRLNLISDIEWSRMLQVVGRSVPGGALEIAASLQSLLAKNTFFIG